MKTHPKNIEELLQGPNRWAHRQVHAQLKLSQQPGQAIYFPGENTHERRPDFLVALEGRTYFSLHLVTLPHAVEDNRLVVVPREGGPSTDSPVGWATAQAVAVSKELTSTLTHRIYIIPVALFMDEGPDNAVQAWGLHHGVAMLCSADSLVERLGQTAGEHREPIYHPPGADEIERVMAYFSGAGQSLATIPVQPAGDLAPEAGITARQVIIQHADRVVVYTVGTGDGDGMEVDRDRL